MYEAMSAARECIYLEMYIFVTDQEELDFLSVLEEKARSGVQVKIILDSFGSRDLSDEATARLRDAGVEAIFFSSFFHRTHRKILVVDQKVAFVGGVNLHPSTKKWDDLVVLLEGAMVKTIVGSFAKVYVSCGGRDEALVAIRQKGKLIKARAWLIEHFPENNKYHFQRVYTGALQKAEKTFTFVTPYFVPRRWLIAAMHQAVLKGVDVELLLPAVSDHYIVDRMNYFYMRKLFKLGIKFYLGPKMNHAKALVVDRKLAVVGTQNMDPLSFDFNAEVGVFIEDPETVKKLVEIIEKWKSDSQPFDPANYQKKWLDYIVWPICRLLFFL